MTNVPESAFPDPEMRQAAQLLVEHQAEAAVAIARRANKIDYVGPEGDSLLLIAIMGNDRNAVDLLLVSGANPNLPVERAPISVAAELAGIETIVSLLDAGAAPDGRVGSESALWRAALGNRFDVVDLLLRHRAQVDLPNVDGDTPALAAVEAGNFKMALHLLQHGASPFAASKSGYTLGFWAARSRIPSAGGEGQARDALIAGLKQSGFPWPPPSPAEIIAARANNNWPK